MSHVLKSLTTRSFKRISTGVILNSFCVRSVHKHLQSKVVVVGGGAGGCSTSAILARSLCKDDVTIIEPAEKHYYQGFFTLIGGGLRNLSMACKPAVDVLPKNARWIKDSVAEFDPKNNTITTAKGQQIKYDVLLVALGIELRYQDVPGLVEGLEKYDNVVSIYSPKYAEKTYKAIRAFNKGDLLYTFPNTPVKCAGAPQKICYIHEYILRQNGKRNVANVTYITPQTDIFHVKRYTDALWKVVQARNINVKLRTLFVELRPDKNEAVFQDMDKPDQKITLGYSLLHATPPMKTPQALRSNKELTDSAGYLSVNKFSLQHTKYPNVFGVGDCTDAPTSKTAAAIGLQHHVVSQNIRSVLNGKPIEYFYNGYSSCPLVTRAGRCIMAEFDYDLTPRETFPIRQNREPWAMYLVKRDVLPTIYWNLMLKGYWKGPSFFRKMLHLGLTN